MTDEILPPTLSEMEAYLEHAGVKGMKWGVRKAKDGAGVIKAKARPTYSVQERRDAKRGVKSAKKGGGAALDQHGFDQTRLSKVLTPQRRIVNGLLGTKWYWAGVAAGNAAILAAAIAVPPASAAAVGLMAAGGLASFAGGTHATYKTFFNNLKQNPKIKGKIKLNADEMAHIYTGKAVRKRLETEHGSIKFSQIKDQQKIDFFDQEGRNVGSQTRSVDIKR